jgi:hypothetical protein
MAASTKERQGDGVSARLSVWIFRLVLVAVAIGVNKGLEHWALVGVLAAWWLLEPATWLWRRRKAAGADLAMPASREARGSAGRWRLVGELAMVAAIVLAAAFPGPVTVGVLVLAVVWAAVLAFLRVLDEEPSNVSHRPICDRLPGPGESAGIGPGGL